MGPFAGALIEFVKILLNFVFTGTDTAGSVNWRILLSDALFVCRPV